MQKTGDQQAESDADRAILSKLAEVQASATKHLEELRLHEAAQEVYQFIWHEFADVYIEASKSQINQTVLMRVLQQSLKLLHPFMPFITEEIWSKLPLENKKLLLVEDWPR